MRVTCYQYERARVVWISCLSSAFRTALACTIVGGATLYGPESLRRQIPFPAFSYVTVILIITDATLGDTLHGCGHALYATFQSVCPAILTLWFIGPDRLTTSITTVAVALNAFVVALPENTDVICRRIALGQIVIIYVIAFINGVHTDAVMHPVHVASSTAVGVLACVLALLVPYPRLACCEVKQNCKLFADNALERLRIYVKAFCAEDCTSALSLISQTKSLAAAGTKLIQNIKSKQESVKWERPPIKFLKPYCMNPGDRLQDIQTPLRGMQIGLSSVSSFPIVMLELKDCLHSQEEKINLTLNQLKICMPFDLATVPEESSAENLRDNQHSFQTLQNIPPTQKDLPSLFFLFCLKLLNNKLVISPSSFDSGKGPTNQHEQISSVFKAIWSSLAMHISKRRLIPAIKCSLSLGLAVLFGLIYSKENGYWSGLPVAVTFASAREATFKVANLKAQGTVLGTVYGVLCCFLFQRFVPLKFLSLFPWFVFCTFLRRSRMYGQAGGVASIIGAVLILGRNNFGPTSEFAIARIVETFIGLSCSIIVEILFQPTRGSTLAKVQLSKSLQILRECVDSIGLSSIKEMEESKINKLKIHVNELNKFVGEAEVEPNFWFLPFHSACYNKLLVSLSKMVDFMFFGTQAICFLQQELCRIDSTIVWKQIIIKLNGDLDLFKDMVSPLIKCFEEVTLIKSLNELEKDSSIDLELGKMPIPIMFRLSDNSDEEEIERIISSYLQHSNEILDKIQGDHDQKELKSQLVIDLGALVFCVSSLVGVTREIEKGIKELLQWENILQAI